ncbi:MAG: phosphate acyltransferase PlsX [Halomonadaceae bacterium]|nr:MAG: phosphate acyltransferase PlsX [Halomonadaceae bacterium]
MTDRITIAVDAMSGDRGAECAVQAAKAAVESSKALSILLVGNQQILEAFLWSPHPRLRIVDAPDRVTMDERPSYALRHKQNSSMAVALRLVRDGEADACVSAGNTGALMALGRSIVKTYPGIERPAIIKRLPAPGQNCYVLDLGANVDASAEHLFQFAIMGSLMAEAIEGIAAPRVALLNVGQEAIKGNEQVRLASHLLSESAHLHYIGFIEGHQLFDNAADVVVCDGFVGNIALKTGEGVAVMLIDLVRKTFASSLWGRAVGMLAAPILRRLLRRMDPARHNGASFIGLQGVVVKSHGNACERGLLAAILQAEREVQQQIPQRLNQRLDELVF